MTEQCLREIIFLLEPVIYENQILNRIALYIALVAAAIFIGLRFSVSPVIIGKGYVAVSIKHAGKLIISAAVFAHTVRNLNNTLGIIDFIPKIAVYGC